MTEPEDQGFSVGEIIDADRRAMWRGFLEGFGTILLSAAIVAGAGWALWLIASQVVDMFEANRAELIEEIENAPADEPYDYVTIRHDGRLIECIQPKRESDWVCDW